MSHLPVGPMCAMRPTCVLPVHGHTGSCSMQDRVIKSLSFPIYILSTPKHPPLLQEWLGACSGIFCLSSPCVENASACQCALHTPASGCRHLISQACRHGQLWGARNISRCDAPSVFAAPAAPSPPPPPSASGSPTRTTAARTGRTSPRASITSSR